MLNVINNEKYRHKSILVLTIVFSFRSIVNNAVYFRIPIRICPEYATVLFSVYLEEVLVHSVLMRPLLLGVVYKWRVEETVTTSRTGEPPHAYMCCVHVVHGTSERCVIRYDGRRRMCVYMNFGMYLDSINSCTLDRNCQRSYSSRAIWMDRRGHRVCAGGRPTHR